MMTDALPLTTVHAADRRQSVSVSPGPQYHHSVQAPAPFVEGQADEDDGIIACICAYSDDDGNTIQCDKCYRWQHIQCYYPPPTEVPGDFEKHYCLDCVHRDDLDARKATERQRRALEDKHGANGVKRSVPKSHKKKVKGSPSLTAQVNGWSSDRHGHIHNHDRKSASPRDQPPPAKRPKTAHRSSGSVSQGRKRTSTSNMARSPSKSPEFDGGIVIPQYSDEFLNLFQPQSPQVETDTNLMNNIAVTNSLSQWLTDSEAVSQSTGGMTPSDIFKRWDGRIEDIPGRPEVSLQWGHDDHFAQDGITPRWAQLTVEQDTGPGTFIGELRGRIGQREDYTEDPDSTWNDLRHPEPFVFFHPQLPIVVDARQEGSMFRYVRRSCQPNAELQTIITEGTEYHFCFMATKDILAGDEVTVAWQIPDTIREKISTSLAQSNNFQSSVKYYIARWVSKVLANCGPCACTRQVNCLMAHYDFRGKSLPPDPIPVKKGRKKKVPQPDTTIISRSRSVSEARKMDPEDDGTDSRSVSGSRGSMSRDITPNTHYSTTTILPEMSERERKKLMREEEMFRRQEEESGRSKKKRHSGGSNLNTPSTATSVRSTPEESDRKSFANRFKQKQLGLPPNAKYADAATSSRPGSASSRPITGKRKSAAEPRTLRKESTAASKGPKPVYVDVSVQCDLDQKPQEVAQRPRRRYVSVTHRLLQRCISNNFKQKSGSLKSETSINETPQLEGLAPSVQDTVRVPVDEPLEPLKPVEDSMDIDEVEAVSHVPNEPEQKPAEVSVEVPPSDIVPTSAEAEPEAVPEDVPEDVPEAVPTEEVDTIMHETISEDALQPESPMLLRKTPDTAPSSSPTSTGHHEPASRGSVDPPPHLVLQTSSPQKKETSPIPQELAPQAHKPVMHVDMPPPQSNPFSSQPSLTPSMTGAQAVQSPGALSPGGPGSLSINPPLFSPSVVAAVSPSPVRKKLSLSDYTRRSKARESQGESSVSPAINVMTSGDDANKENESGGEVSTADQVAEIVQRAKEAAAAETAKEDGEINDTAMPEAMDDTESAVIDEGPPINLSASTSATTAPTVSESEMAVPTSSATDVAEAEAEAPKTAAVPSEVSLQQPTLAEPTAAVGSATT